MVCWSCNTPSRPYLATRASRSIRHPDGPCCSAMLISPSRTCGSAPSASNGRSLSASETTAAADFTGSRPGLERLLHRGVRSLLERLRQRHHRARPTGDRRRGVVPDPLHGGQGRRPAGGLTPVHRLMDHGDPAGVARRPEGVDLAEEVGQAVWSTTTGCLPQHLAQHGQGGASGLDPLNVLVQAQDGVRPRAMLLVPLHDDNRRTGHRQPNFARQPREPLQRNGIRGIPAGSVQPRNDGLWTVGLRRGGLWTRSAEQQVQQHRQQDRGHDREQDHGQAARRPAERTDFHVPSDAHESDASRDRDDAPIDAPAEHVSP